MIYNSYQIADIIGVNVSTIKRWTDTGKLTCHQTPGGHRKFHLKDISEFIKKNKKVQKSVNIKHIIGKNDNLATAINDLNTSYLINYCYKSLINGDKDKFISVTNALILKGNPIYMIFDDLLIPILKKIGDQWSKNKLSISAEHLASEIIRKLLSNLNFNHTPERAKYNAFCFTLVNDKHEIPIQMAEAMFNSNKNIKTFNLGPNLPVDDFINLSQKIVPDIIFISIIYIQNPDIINKEIKTLFSHFEKMKTKIFMSGSGLDSLELTNFNFTKIDSFKDLYDKVSE